MTIWITVPPGRGVLFAPDQADGQLIATISVDHEHPSDARQVQLAATGVWKGKQVTESINVTRGSALELRLY
jgi:hypothetical protein